MSQDATKPARDASLPEAQMEKLSEAPNDSALEALEKQLLEGAPDPAEPQPVSSAATVNPDALEGVTAPASEEAETAVPTLELHPTAAPHASDPYATMDLEDGVYIPDDELEPTTVEAPEPAAPSSESDDGFLEEQTEAVPTERAKLQLERGEYIVTGYDAVGRTLATAPDGSQVVIASYQGGAAVTRALYPHPMLPPLLDAGEDAGRTLIAHPKLQGRTLEDALNAHELQTAVRAVLDLTRFNRYLFARGFALVGLEPREVLLQPTRLSKLPSVRKIGDDAPAEAPRYGAPERAAGATVQGSEGVYTLGAMLYHALEGRALSEGELPAQFPELPGSPQALTAMLAPASQRANPHEALDLVMKLSAALAPRRRWLMGQSSSVGINPDRSTNEDSCGALQRASYGDAGTEISIVACVADGMGGMAKGEHASQAAVRGFLGFETHDLSRSTVADATQHANARVIGALEGKSGGCTFTGIIAEGERVVLGHVGDTRAYLVTDQLVQQITEDHSMVMMLVKMGIITPEEAHNHPDSNKVMRALGSNRVLPPDYVDTAEITVQPTNRIVIMSDGVWGALLPNDLEAMLLVDQPVQDMADALVRAALKAGSTDNATAMVLMFEERDAL